MTKSRSKNPSKSDIPKRQRQRIERLLPPVGTVLRASRSGIKYKATIVSAPEMKGGKAVKLDNKVYTSLSGAARAVTGHMINGWKFWHIE